MSVARHGFSKTPGPTAVHAYGNGLHRGTTSQLDMQTQHEPEELCTQQIVTNTESCTSVGYGI